MSKSQFLRNTKIKNTEIEIYSKINFKICSNAHDCRTILMSESFFKICLFKHFIEPIHWYLQKSLLGFNRQAP